jgi:hypothetical protein
LEVLGLLFHVRTDGVILLFFPEEKFLDYALNLDFVELVGSAFTGNGAREIF